MNDVNLKYLQTVWDYLLCPEYEKIKWLIGNHKALGLSCQTVKDFLKPEVVDSNPLSETWRIRNLAVVRYFYPWLDMREHFGILYPTVEVDSSPKEVS